MKLHELKYTEGSKKKATRVGRGNASGKGKTSTRGHKGQNSRSGGGVRPGFEGGQTPLFRRIPKVGFTSLNRKEYKIINLDMIENLDLKEVNHKTLLEKKVIKNEKTLVKVLGNGKISKGIVLKVNKVSKSAEEAIKSAGGTIEVI
ncbi:50S ribosomal protein L15 [Spiroplasma turonicum]|uniref:Large ribosomal subunit protein uL15 n=1 Tax=Spiroplasma turonicum TaxID=216946 RepID=A0A0K1P7G2_9MOLU|nr:50S ribosomal protein L15 [Spiroplasma turonicum]AKU80251.1 50S ribosomal protein L15 [Spiroplasma turonicum]ALX71252.1 50S ribosomal protein L15 [Spiroplasma turonicum]